MYASLIIIVIHVLFIDENWPQCSKCSETVLILTHCDYPICFLIFHVDLSQILHDCASLTEEIESKRPRNIQDRHGLNALNQQ